MAVVTVKSTNISNSEASPQTMNPVTQSGGRVREKVATVAITNGDSIASRFQLFRVPSNARISMLLVRCDAITAAIADFGLYQTTANGGAVVDADAYAAVQTLVTAITILPIDVAFKTRNITAVGNYVWQDAGLTADSMREYYIEATLTAAATATGDLTAQLFYVVD